MHWKEKRAGGNTLALCSTGDSKWLLQTPKVEEVFQGFQKVEFEFHLLKCVFQFLADTPEVDSSVLVLNSSLCRSFHMSLLMCEPYSWLPFCRFSEVPGWAQASSSGTNTPCSHSTCSLLVIVRFDAACPTHVYKTTNMGSKTKLPENEPQRGYVTAVPI